MLSRRSILRVPLEASLEEAGQEHCLGILYVILLHEFFLQPLLRQLVDPLEFARSIIELGGIVALEQEGLISALANKLRDRGQMVIFLRIRHANLWFEEEVTCDELEDHAGETPDIRRGVVPAPENDLGRSILPSLNHVRSVVVSEAGVAHVDYLDVEHAIANLLQLRSSLGLQLVVHLQASIRALVTINSHSLLNLLALHSAEILILDFIPFSLVPEFLEVVGGVLLDELLVRPRRVLEPNVSISHVTLS